MNIQRSATALQVKGVSGKIYTYDESKTLGAGAFGIVYPGVEASTGRKVALKMLRMEKKESKMIFERETRAYREVKPHSCIIEMLDYVRYFYRPSWVKLEKNPAFEL